MAASSADKILKDLQQGIFSPLYFLCGEEPFFIDQISDYIEDNALSDAEKGFNQTVMYGKDVSMNNILESSRSFPMMATRQVIIIKEAQDLADFRKKEAQGQLAEYAKNPAASTILVFCHKHKKPDVRTEMYKTLQKNAVLLESKKLYDNQLPDWITSYCKEKKCTIRGKAAAMLSEYIGNNLSSLAKAIEKVLINVSGQKIEITDSMVSEYVGISKEFNVFELQTAFARRNALKVYQILDYFAANPKNNPIIPVISSLFNYFNKVLLVHTQQGKSDRELASVLKVNPFFVKEYLQAARNFPLSKTLQIIGFLQTADLQSKGVNSVASDSQILKELAFKVLN